MRRQPIVTNEYYHIYNRGVDKRNIFSDKIDIKRFIESIIEFNQIDGIGSLVNKRKQNNQIEPKALSRRNKNKPLVGIVTYCLNPNHFHFVLKQLIDGGVAKFMQKLQGGYTYYFNIKNSRTGSLLQGTFKANHLSNENSFNKAIGYVNKNYKIHNIPKNKLNFVFASDYEYENNNFKIVSKIEGKKILKIFNGSKSFKKHCEEIISMARKEKGKTDLLKDENIQIEP